MNFNLQGRDLEITPSMENLMKKKLSKLDRLFPKDASGTVVMSKQKGIAKIEITIPARNGAIRTEQTGTDLYALMDDAVDSMERQQKKFRTKLQDYWQHGRDKTVLKDETEEENEVRIVRTKRFAVKPMDAEEACLQMELLGHTFYMFLNSETNEVNVVYRRADGTYGLIEPVLGDE